MHSHVCLQATLLRARVITLCTTEGLLSCVHSHVYLQITWLRARVVTLTTTEGLLRLFTNVLSHMPFQNGQIWARMATLGLHFCGSFLILSIIVKSFSPWVQNLDFWRWGILRWQSDNLVHFSWLQITVGAFLNIVTSAPWIFAKVLTPRMLNKVVGKLMSEIFIWSQNFLVGPQGDTWPECLNNNLMCINVFLPKEFFIDGDNHKRGRWTCKKCQ